MPDNLYDVLHDFKDSFLLEKKELQNRVLEIETEIQECKLFIESLNRKEECDYNIFSPRSSSRIYKDQVYEKNVRIEELEEELKGIYKKISIVTKKLDSLDSVSSSDNNEQFIVHDDVDNVDNSITETVTENSTVESTLSDKCLFLKMQEDDRQRIAAELHDSVLQNLSLVMHNLELAEKFIDVDPIRAKLELATNRKLVKTTIDDIRNTIFDLRPMQFNDFGFKKAVENYIDTLKSRTSIDLQYSIEEIDNLDKIVLMTVFRIIQELVNNAIEHSNASCVSIVVLFNGNNIIIEVTDDGIGFDPLSMNKENHFGLKILNDRVCMINGDINYPVVDKGFKISITVPCN